ncbi:MAG: hypothetical protein JWN01_760 [Patescibacteria group bacterium]|nr:hypothetical protein [Patescibacteria group bacterium]
MASPDWTTLSTIASTVALVMGGFLWLASKVFNLGKTTQRLDNIEADLTALKHQVHTEVNAVRNDLNQRMDKLILTIAESNHSK